MQFTKAARAEYLCEKAKRGKRDDLQAQRDSRPFQRPRKQPKRDEGRKLVLPGTWVFHGAGKPYNERWTFIPAPKRQGKKVPLSFNPGCFKKRPTLRGLDSSNIRKQRHERQSFDCKPNHYQSFGAWEQEKHVQRTRLPRPEKADLRAFLIQNHFCTNSRGVLK
jgi:hypothetical protein